MGAWGSSLYANDIASDVRESYMIHLRNKLSNQEAYEKIIESFEGIDELLEDAPLFWYALADTQWRTGRLMPEVKAKALDWIDKKGGMILWEESKSGCAGWQKTLDNLKKKLLTEQPKEKKIRKPVVINQNPWNLGDVYAYRFHCEKAKERGYAGKYIVLQKMGESNNGVETKMLIQLYNKIFNEVPTISDIEGVKLLPFENLPLRRYPDGFVDPEPHKILDMNYQIYAYVKKDYPADNLVYLGNFPPMESKNLNQFQIPWTWAYLFFDWFQSWQGHEYEVHEEGLFKYTYPE